MVVLWWQEEGCRLGGIVCQRPAVLAALEAQIRPSTSIRDKFPPEHQLPTRLYGNPVSCVDEHVINDVVECLDTAHAPSHTLPNACILNITIHNAYPHPPTLFLLLFILWSSTHTHTNNI